MKKLPISNTPYIRAYTHHAYPNVIINNESTTSDMLAHIKIPDEVYSNLQVESEKVDIIEKNKEITIKSNPYELNNNCCIYRKMKNKDSFVIEILNQQYVNHWGNINIFITQNKKLLLDDSSYFYSYGNFCGAGIYFKINNNFVNINNSYIKETYPLFLKIEIDEEFISGYYSYDGVNWDISFNNIIKDKLLLEDELYIGVKFALSDNHYYNWMFSNYIQIMLNDNWANVPSNVSIDYYVTPQKKWNYYTVHNLIDYKYETQKVISDYNLDIIDYIIIQINHCYYVEALLNEKYVPCRNAYQAYDFNHSNLIYGYDKLKKILYIMGYGKRNKPTLSEITYDEFTLAYSTSSPDADIYLLKYAPDTNIYRLDIKQIIYSIESYIKGKNLSLDISNLFVPLKGAFGINVYDGLMENDNTINIFMHDIRISYLLLEHKKIMKDRIAYFIARGIINTDTSIEVVTIMDKIYSYTELVNNLIIKHNMIENSEIIFTVKQLMKEIKKLEIDCYNKLIQLLTFYLTHSNEEYLNNE